MVRELGMDVPASLAGRELRATDAEGSIYALRLLPSELMGYLSLNATVSVVEGAVAFGHISKFARFCLHRNLGLRRHGREIHSEGELLSDLMNSEAFRLASHAACHPFDRKPGN